MKKIIYTSVFVAMAIVNSNITNAQNLLFENPFSDTEKTKWTGVCQGPITAENCPNLQGFTDKMLAENEKQKILGKNYENWVINARQQDKPQTTFGLTFKQEMPGAYTASFPIVIEKFAKNDEYILKFDLSGVYAGRNYVDKPFLQISLGEYKIHENDTTSPLAGKIVNIPKRNSTETIERGNNIPTGKAYRIDESVINLNGKPTENSKTENKTTTLEFAVKWSDICGMKDCKENEKLITSLKFSGILVNNYSAGGGNFMGSDFVIHNMSVDRKDLTPPEVDFSEIIFDNGAGVTIASGDGTEENRVKIPLGNGVTFDFNKGKTIDNIDPDAYFGNKPDIFSHNEIGSNGRNLIATAISDSAWNHKTIFFYYEILENDKSALQTEIDKKIVKNEDKYTLATPEKQENYNKALEEAEKILTNRDALTKDINKAIADLKKAYDELDGKAVDKTKLETEIKEEKIKNNDKYQLDTDEDQKNYDTILDEAKKVFGNPDATQKEVDEATKKLADARGKLDGKKTETPTPTNNSGNGGGGPGGYVALTPVKETEPTKPITTADNQNIFKTGNIGGQCVSIVKNLDEPRLVDYYTSTLDIRSGREVHTSVSRGEFMKMLFLASGLDISNIALRDVGDVDVNNPYARYISAGLYYGLVHGQTDGTHLYFRPNDELSRAEAAKIFIRAANLRTSAFTGIFSDVSSTLTLSEYIESAYNNCLLHGRKTLNGQPMNGKPRVFEPYSSITIAETAKVLYNMMH